MTKKLNKTLFFAIAIFIAGCSQILQAPKLKVEQSDRLLQQEFSIIEKTLTLSEAKSRSSDPFIRSVIQTGIGDRARLVSEDVAIKSNFPNQQKKGSYDEYELGIGDVISFINLIENSKTEIGWGHQIRSYVLQPYRLIKDNRTNFESTNPDKVLDGEIDEFLEQSLYRTK